MESGEISYVRHVEELSIDEKSQLPDNSLEESENLGTDLEELSVACKRIEVRFREEVKIILILRDSFNA